MALKGRGRKGRGRGMRGPRMLALTNQFGSRGGGMRRVGGRMSGPRPGRFVMGNAFDKQHSVNFGKDTQKRVTWLNYNVFTENKIDQSAVLAMRNLPRPRVMALCKELEEKGPEQVKNPSGYLKAAVRRETGFGGKGMGKGMMMGGKGNSENYNSEATQKRITWLNYNVFQENKINRQAAQVLQMLPRNRVMALCKDVENKAGEIKNPSAYLEAAAKREMGMGGMGRKGGGMRKGKGKGKAMRAMRKPVE